MAELAKQARPGHVIVANLLGTLGSVVVVMGVVVMGVPALRAGLPERQDQRLSVRVGTVLTQFGSATRAGWSPAVTLFHGEGSLLTGVSCVSNGHCVAVGAKGSGGIRLSGPNPWSAPVVIDHGGGLASISCAPGGTCEAVGASAFVQGVGVAFELEGRKWSNEVATGTPLASVSCPTTSFCVGVDNFTPHAHGVVFDGRAWSKPTVIGATPDAISCPSTGFCVAVSQTGKVLYYKNRTWSKPTSIDPSGSPTSISCPSTTFCIVVDANGDALTYAHARWSKSTVVDPSTMTGVSCPRTNSCMAVDASGAALSYNGSRWSAPHTISSQVQFTAVSCPTTSFCVAVGQNSSTTAAYAAVYESASRGQAPGAHRVAVGPRGPVR